MCASCELRLASQFLFLLLSAARPAGDAVLKASTCMGIGEWELRTVTITSDFWDNPNPQDLQCKRSLFLP